MLPPAMQRIQKKKGRDVMELNRREFLIGSAAAIGAAAIGEGTSHASDRQGQDTESAGAAQPTYEIYALKWAGPVPRKLAVVLWWEGWDKDVEMNYYVWAIKGKDEIIVVDTGSDLSLANQRKMNYYVNPVEALATLGANKTNVKKVIITHCHWDHLAGIEKFCELFPKQFSTYKKKSLISGPKIRLLKELPLQK